MSRVSDPRPPAVAGRFYPGTPGELARAVAGLMPAAEATPALALVGPHAGYVYSGAICGETYARVIVPKRAVVMAPNHTGHGARRSIWDGGDWDLPGFRIPVDRELSARVSREAGLEPDRDAHLLEHALEVHLPFLHARQPSVRIVPITLGQLDLEGCRRIGEGIARAIGPVRAAGEDVLLVASTDMSHYEPADRARARDRLAIDRVLALDPEGLYETVRRNGITMCGYIPTTVALFAANVLGASTTELVRYGNSGEASGDFDRVVGYAGMIIR